MSRSGYIFPTGCRSCVRDLRLGAHCYVDDDVVIFDRGDGGHLALGDAAHLYRGTIIELGQGGSVEIGANSHIQPNCQFTAFVGSVRIGRGVQVAPGCALLPLPARLGRGSADCPPAADQPRGHRDRR